MAINETIVTGRKFRKLIDEGSRLWQRISFWTKAADVEFDDGKNAEEKFAELKKFVSDGKKLLADAITGKGVSTAGEDTFEAMADNIESIIVSTGNATEDQVLQGATFSNASGNNKIGTMANRGNWISNTSGNGNVMIPQGYHNGSGYVNCSGAYNAGMAAADKRVNTSSENWQAGYNAGHDAGYWEGYHVGYNDGRYNPI